MDWLAESIHRGSTVGSPQTGQRDAPGGIIPPQRWQVLTGAPLLPLVTERRRRSAHPNAYCADGLVNFHNSGELATDCQVVLSVSPRFEPDNTPAQLAQAGLTPVNKRMPN